MSFETAVTRIHQLISQSKPGFSKEQAIKLATHLKENPRAKITPLVARYKLSPDLLLRSRVIIRELHN